jgi:Lrp/AsnC family transcriptional regulator for asnA, asnC and gidA
MKLDELDLKIVRLLWDGRTPYADIAKKVGLTTNTVRARVTRLKDEGILQIIGLVDPFAIPGHSAAFIGFSVEARRLVKIAEEIRKLKGIVGCACVSGRFNLIAMVMFNEQFSHRNLVLEELPKIDGIISLETFFVVEAEQFNLRYVL